MKGVIAAFVPPTPRPIKTIVIASPATPDPWLKSEGRDVRSCTSVPQKYKLDSVSMLAHPGTWAKIKHLKLIQRTLYRPSHASDARANGTGTK